MQLLRILSILLVVLTVGLVQPAAVRGEDHVRNSGQNYSGVDGLLLFLQSASFQTLLFYYDGQVPLWRCASFVMVWFYYFGLLIS